MTQREQPRAQQPQLQEANKRIEAVGGKQAVALRGEVLGRRHSCAMLGKK